MNVPATVRALRAHLRWSQRQLAAAADVPHTTLSRIESGQCDPKISTVLRLAAAIGGDLVLVDRKRRPIDPDEVKERLRDCTGRHFPAHLHSAKTPDYMDVWAPQWWGWHHIAFPPSQDDRKPEYTFWRRRNRPWTGMWDDAT